MLSDSSSSDLNCSPVFRRRVKRQQFSTSDDSSDDDSPVKRPLRGVRSRVPSSSSSSCSERPRKRRRAIVESDSSDFSDSYDSDGPTLPFRKDALRRNALVSDSDSYSSEIQTALGTSSLKDSKNDGSSSDSEGEHCIICFKSLQHPVARPSSCSHVFHEQCLSTWSKTSNTCPIDRVKYNCINTVNSDGKVLSQRNVSTPVPGEHSDFEPDNPTFCEICHFHDREEVMLLCDRCDAGYHIDCLDPPLDTVPTGQWFCPSCELTNIEDSEVLELLADNVLLENRLRGRPQRPSRVNPRLQLTRAVRAAINLANDASSQVSSQVLEEPSTSTGRRSSSIKKPRRGRKKSQRKRTTKYKVELVTTEDGTPVEVKLAIQSRRYGKKKKKTSSKSSRGSRRSGGRCKDEVAGSSHGPHSYHPAPLDLFGSRATLDYFSGCEAEDEEELGGGGEVGLLRAGQSALASRSGLMSRKGIARALSNSVPSPRVRPNIEAPVSSVNLLDDILRDQELWHHPGPANISSSSDGALRVTLPKDTSGCSTRESAIHGNRNDRGGGRYSGGRYNSGRFSGGRMPSRGSMSGRNISGGSMSASMSGTSSAGPSGSSVGSFNQSQSNLSVLQPIPAPPVPPLIPPPEPPLRLVEDDDLDIYGDIEPPPSMAKLVPPPEPPAMLLALDNQAVDDGVSSPDEALVIDDQRDTYDPDQPNSPSSGNRTDEDETSEKRPVDLPDIPLPTQGIRLEDIKLPSPSKNDDDSDSEVPITEHYSKASLKMARLSNDNSSSSEEDGQYIDDIIERFKKAPPLKENASGTETNSEEQATVEESPVKEKLRKYGREIENVDENESCTEKVGLEGPGKNNIVQTVKESGDGDIPCISDDAPVRDEKEMPGDEREDSVDQQIEEPCNKRPSTPSEEIDDVSVEKDTETIEKENADAKDNNEQLKDISSEEKKYSPEYEEVNEEIKLDSENQVNAVEVSSSEHLSKDDESTDNKKVEQQTESETINSSFERLSPKPQRKRRYGAKADDKILEPDKSISTDETNNDVSIDDDDDELQSEGASPSYKDDNEGYLSAEDKRSVDNDIDLFNGHSPAKSLSSGEVQSDGPDSLDISESSLSSVKRSGRKRKMSHDDEEYEKGQTESLISGTAEGDKDGLVEITDDEMSSYEKNWEMEENEKIVKQSGLEGLETEAISECEDALCEDTGPVSQAKNNNTETYLSKEEGEIITDDRNEFIPWKRVTKSTKDRSYREKEKGKDKEKEKTPEKKKKEKKKEKRKDLERYDIRKVIGDKRKKDEFGRDIASSQSRSVSRESGVIRSEVRRVRDWSKSRKRSRARSLSRSRNRERSSSRGKRRRSRGRSLDRGRTKSNYARDKNRKRSRGRSKTRKDQSRDRKKSQTNKGTVKKRAGDKSSERRDRNGKEKSRDDRDKTVLSSSSCSTCSCSSCERERLATNKLAVSVPSAPSPKKSKDKKKDKSRKSGKKDNKRRRTESPLPSKEVFTSGDNILVSVNFKSSSRTSGEPRRGGSRRVWEEENRKKKDKENQPVRSVVPILAATQEKDKRRQRRRMASNAKPVAIIDLDPSPFREEAVSPAEVIILTDESDNEASGKPETIHQSSSTGPKTPPEPPVKFTISSKPPLRSLTNPLEEADEEGDRVDDDGGEPMVMHKGPNTPPEPPETYDPFEPTKSRSPSPRRDNIRGPTSTDNQIVNNNEVLSDGKQQSSPQPKTQEVVIAEKPNFMTEADSDFCLGGDSPYSPGSSEADDLFDPPPVTPTRSKPLRPLGTLPLPPTPLQSNKAKLTPSPTKRRQANNRLTPVMRKAPASKKEVGIRLDENQLKILDELPSSAVEMQVKDKFLKKLNRQERVVEEVKFVLKPHYNKKHVTKEEYKDILRKAVPKICHSRSGEINPFKIQKLVEAYVKKYRHKRKKSGPAPLGGAKPKQAKVLPPILKSMFGNLGMRSQDTMNNRNAANK